MTQLPPTAADVDFDLPGTMARMLDDEDMFRSVLPLFLTDAAERLVLLRHAVATGDAAEISLQAHTLKGAAANLGAQTMASTADNLWLHARDGQLAAIREDLARIELDFGRYRVAVAAWL
jgi:HPt (histidine-containing phosphotransfer) domain-containing protein